MKKILFSLMFFLIGFSFNETYAKDVHVNGYYRNDGTYVKPHVRTSPDSYKWNNYSSPGGTSYVPGEKY